MGLKVLLVDDDPLALLVLQELLALRGWETENCADGTQAQERLSRAAAGEFDLVITDWMMPNMDGIELTRWVRRQIGETPRILLITSMDGNMASQYALRSGANGFLRKPVVESELDGLLAELFRAPERSPSTPC